MAKLPSKLIRVVGVVVTLAIVAGVVYFGFLRGSSTKSLTAQFSEAVGVYPGTPVEILGIQVGDVTSVEPRGGHVDVKLDYDANYKVPANVTAVLVANSLVSDRYVQLAPVYRSGPTIADGATIPLKRTQSPAELDDIYAALNKLSVALGPQGANKGGKKTGPLSTLLDVAAANLKGNGSAIGNSIANLADAAQTLANGRHNLFATVHNLREFTSALSDSDQQIRLFNGQLAQVSGDLASERSDLGLALHDLAIALDQVNSFVKNNANRFHTSFHGLQRVLQILVNEKSSLNETLAVAPYALANIVHAYQPNIGGIATRGNMVSATDLQPKTVCALLYSTIHDPGAPGNVLGPLTGTINKVCKKALGSKPLKVVQQILNDLAGGNAGDVPKQIRKLLGGAGIGVPGGVGSLVGAGGGQ